MKTSNTLCVLHVLEIEKKKKPQNFMNEKMLNAYIQVLFHNIPLGLVAESPVG